jgi:chromosome segregation ATPase
MKWPDILGGVNRLTKAFHTIEQRVDRLGDDLRRLTDQLDLQREKLAFLETRVAVLEEGRKTTAAEVKVALLETLSSWEMRKMREEIEARKAYLPSSNPSSG